MLITVKNDDVNKNACILSVHFFIYVIMNKKENRGVI